MKLKSLYLLVLLRLVNGCSEVPQRSAELSQAVASDVFILLEPVSATESRLWVATGDTPANINICSGPAADCTSGKGPYLSAAFQETRGGRSFYRADQTSMLMNNLVLAVMVLGQTPQEHRILQTIRISEPGSSTLPPAPPPGQAGEFNLAFGGLFNQKNTQWCWAFSAYHALRTYYYNLPDNGDANVQAWKSALRELDTQEAFWKFMGLWVRTKIKTSVVARTNLSASSKKPKIYRR